MFTSVGVQDKASRYHTVSSLGKSQHLTKEGFLVCEAVPIARIGELLYGPGETPLETGRDGIVRVIRDVEEVFRPEALASFEGKPVTNDHPDEEVTPENFRTHVVGSTHNVRRGEGIDNDLMLADLIIQDKEAIEDVQSGKREVSCGYDADYEQISAGRGRQKNIVGNHVALVKQGRCGSRCAIQDEDRSSTMAKSWTDKIMEAFKSKDEDALKKALAEQETDKAGGVHVHVNGGSDKTAEAEKPPTKDEIAAMVAQGIKDAMKEAAKGKKGETEDEEVDDADKEDEDEEDDKEDKEKAEKKKKSKAKDTAARLEILVPGTKLPTLDSADPKKFKDTLCKCQRKALDTALEEHPILDSLFRHVDIKTASASTIDGLFIAASEMVKQANNALGSRTFAKTSDNAGTKTPAELNEIYKKFWANPTVA